jgi:hypothetical protein
MFKIIWDKLVDIMGDKITLICIGILIAGYGIYHVNQYVMTKPGFANEKVKMMETVDVKINSVDSKSSRNDLMIKYKIIQMEKSSIEQQQWALEDRIEEEAVAPTISQQNRLYKMEKRIDDLRQEEMEIQKELSQ